MKIFKKAGDAVKKIVVIGPILFMGRKLEKKSFPKKPILILACPRSGTTLLLSILSAVPSIHAVSKQTYAFDRWKKEGNHWVPTLLHRLYREFILHKISKYANRWLEKTPGHIRSIDKILAYFKNDVKIIHIIRDGRDVTVSTHPAYRDRRKYWVPAERWVTEVKTGLAFRDHPSVYTLTYENLIHHYEGEIKKVLTFIEEPFTEKLMNWTAHTHIKSSIHWGTNVQDVHSKSIGKWKSPEHEGRINEFMNNIEAVRLLQELGYSV